MLELDMSKGAIYFIMSGLQFTPNLGVNSKMLPLDVFVAYQRF